MKTRFGFGHFSTLCGSVAGFLLALSASSAWSVTNVDAAAFELDGNALEATGRPPEDWQTLYAAGANSGGASTKFTDILNDEPVGGVDPSIFTGGRKDIQDTTQWGHKAGSSPDKDEITNAYAAAYEVDGDLHIYFGADRISNVGDAFMGFWFFKKKVVANPTGSFTGSHTEGDVLVLVNFPQGANASPQISVVSWAQACNGAANNNPQVGQCVADNLLLKFKGSAVCGTAGVTTACAIANNENGPNDPTASPWPYQSKNDSTANQFPHETFYEGGINLSQLIPGDNCFSSFLAETRSSSSFTATLKDWVLGDFELCSVDITKDCTDGTVNGAEDGFVFNYNGVVTNDGAGALYDVYVVDNNGTSSTSDDITHVIGDLAKGATAPYSGTIESTLNPPTNRVDVYAAASSGGTATVTDFATATCPAIDRDPRLSVTKVCETEVIEQEGVLVLKVNYSGQVCNTSASLPDNAITINNVSVTDDSGTPSDTTDDNVRLSGVSLPATGAGACQDYTGSYLPGAPSGVPHELSFTDTVTARGTAALGFGNVLETKSATCPLCD